MALASKAEPHGSMWVTHRVPPLGLLSHPLHPTQSHKQAQRGHQRYVAKPEGHRHSDTQTKPPSVHQQGWTGRVQMLSARPRPTAGPGPATSGDLDTIALSLPLPPWKAVALVACQVQVTVSPQGAPKRSKPTHVLTLIPPFILLSRGQGQGQGVHPPTLGLLRSSQSYVRCAQKYPQRYGSTQT